MNGHDQTARRAAAPAAPGAVPTGSTINTPLNAVLILGAAAMAVLQLFLLPFILRVEGRFGYWMLVPIVLTTPLHWGLIHEAIHGQLLPRRRLNDGVARGLSIGLALPFEAVRFGHLMHHRFAREAFDRPDVLACSPDRPRDGAARLRACLGSDVRWYWQSYLRYYLRLCGGLYLGELLLPLGAFLPAPLVQRLVERSLPAAGLLDAEVRRRFVHFAGEPRRRGLLRRDYLLVLGLFGGAGWLYGRHWPVLVLTMLLRGAWLSFADNLPHYRVALDEPGRARDFRLARWGHVLVMNHHLHRTHHLYPTLPWHALPQAAAQRVTAPPAPLDASYVAAFFSQLRGPRPLPRSAQ